MGRWSSTVDGGDGAGWRRWGAAPTGSPRPQTTICVSVSLVALVSLAGRDVGPTYEPLSVLSVLSVRLVSIACRQACLQHVRVCFPFDSFQHSRVRWNSRGAQHGPHREVSGRPELLASPQLYPVMRTDRQVPAHPDAVKLLIHIGKDGLH
ncbi:hypothetical protein BDV95DRAFT_64112 [Massariosphaeria phaeospora]|uniref:Uncharacterized protein n=1 Tax=Massariosphaeria phaeospora TaxID=100035 RepID=A0A7C8I4D8_9PLEO|nr:hypothetical protein BDV95DRAFT_64112 [Massariosphaeria phaeospora]